MSPSVTHDVKKLEKKWAPRHFLLYSNNSSQMPKSGFERSEKVEYIREMIHLLRVAGDVGIHSEKGREQLSDQCLNQLRRLL